MASIRRGTTPTLTLNIDNETFNNSSIFITIKQDTKRNEDIIITKSNKDILVTPTDTGSILSVGLSQQETLKLQKGHASIQARWIDSYGTAKATKIKSIDVEETLLEEVINYGSK